MSFSDSSFRLTDYHSLSSFKEPFIKSDDSLSEIVPIRLSECHDFAWSRNLYKIAGRKMAINAATILAIYIAGFAVLAAYDDLDSFIDILYLLVSTLTTVGLGDISPRTFSSRVLACFLLPTGLVIIGFALAALVQLARSIPPSRSSTSSMIARKLARLRSHQSYFVLKHFWETHPLIRQVIILISKFYGTLVFGACVFYISKDSCFEHISTFTDAMYFAMATSTTVGYGKRIVPSNAFAKWFMVFFMIFSTIAAANLINELVDFIVERWIGQQITNTIINSTIHIHHSNLRNDGKVTECDFILFKLLQLQKVDIPIFEKIVSRYHDLDVDNSGALDVGVEIPSAQQVKELQRIAAAEVSERHLKEQRPLRIIWKEQRGRLTSNTIASEEIESPRCGGTNLKKETSEKVKSADSIECGQYFTRLTECFDFKWSRNLWKSASKSTGKWRMWLVLIYVTLSLVFSWNTVKHSEKLDENQPTAVDVLYFFAASISTVGLGDIAPTSQVARAFAVMVIPLGLCLLSLQLSFVSTQRYSLDINTRTHGHPNYNKAATKIQTEFRAFRNRRDLQKNFGLSRPQRKRLQHRQQLKQVLLQRQQKASAFQNARRVLVNYIELFLKTTFGRMSVLLAKLFSVVFVGAIWIRVFLKAHKASDGDSSLSWTDSFYFATTIATSVGYGDIFPRHSDKWSKVFLTFYFIWSTVTLAMLLGTFVELLCELSDNSVVSAIIDSTIWVHKIDLEDRGQVTESGYVLFKLMQMQKVDESCLNLLIGRWRELDANRDGFLQIGVEIPSAEQVVELQRLARRERSRTGKLPTLEGTWDRYRQEIIAQSALESSRERRESPFS